VSTYIALSRKIDAMIDAPIRFPIRLLSELREINLGSDVTIRAITEDDRPQLLGIKSATFDENGRLKTWVVDTADPLSNFVGPDIGNYDQLCSSNYVATLPSRQEAKNLNLAFKLFAHSCTALWIGTSGDTNRAGHPRHFLGPPCYFGSLPLKLDSEGTGALGTLLSACRNLEGDMKFSVMADIFLYAMSVAPRNESRCIELAIVLEMLLLPKASSELSYRFALRLAKLASTQFGESSQEWFAKGKQIYKTRSSLVHSGQDNTLEQSAFLIEETTRRMLAMYVGNPTLFEESVLDSLCVAA
jgi:Apea-like HEPN